MDENKLKQNEEDIKVLRTYSSDMADAVRINEMSVIKIALAEKEKREQEALYKEVEGSKASKIFLLIGGIILIIGAVVVSYLLIQKKKAIEIPQPIIANTETFISYDSQSSIDVANITNVNDLVGIINQDLQTNTGLIKILFLTKKTNDVSTNLTSKSFISLIQSSAPGTLTRSLTDNYLFGKYTNIDSLNEKDKSATFLIFQTSDYAQAYASMLDWEKTMLKDLFVLFNINITDANSSMFNQQWKDIVISNKDARVLYGENGDGILYYAFINKNNFVITDNVEALKEIISRLLIKNNI